MPAVTRNPRCDAAPPSVARRRRCGSRLAQRLEAVPSEARRRVEVIVLRSRPAASSRRDRAPGMLRGRLHPDGTGSASLEGDGAQERPPPRARVRAGRCRRRRSAANGSSVLLGVLSHDGRAVNDDDAAHWLDAADVVCQAEPRRAVRPPTLEAMAGGAFRRRDRAAAGHPSSSARRSTVHRGRGPIVDALRRGQAPRPNDAAREAAERARHPRTGRRECEACWARGPPLRGPLRSPSGSEGGCGGALLRSGSSRRDIVAASRCDLSPQAVGLPSTEHRARSTEHALSVSGSHQVDPVVGDSVPTSAGPEATRRSTDEPLDRDDRDVDGEEREPRRDERCAHALALHRLEDHRDGECGDHRLTTIVVRVVVVRGRPGHDCRRTRSARRATPRSRRGTARSSSRSVSAQTPIEKLPARRPGRSARRDTPPTREGRRAARARSRGRSTTTARLPPHPPHDRNEPIRRARGPRDLGQGSASSRCAGVPFPRCSRDVGVLRENQSAVFSRCAVEVGEPRIDERPHVARGRPLRGGDCCSSRAFRPRHPAEGVAVTRSRWIFAPVRRRSSWPNGNAEPCRRWSRSSQSSR